MIFISGSLINLVENIEVLKRHCLEPYAGISILLPMISWIFVLFEGVSDLFNIL